MKINEEEKSLAILYANFQGKMKKSSDWIYIAEKCKELSNYYGSYKKLAEKLGISAEEVRATLKLLELPEEVKQLIKERKLLHDVAWRIASVKGKKNQIRIAKAVSGLQVHDARDVVRRYRNFPDMNIDNYIKNLKDSKSKIEKISLVIVPLEEDKYYTLTEIAKKNRVSPEKMVNIIVKKWLERNK
jgi:hypothetical protein